MTNLNINRARQSLAPGDKVELYKLDLSPLGTATPLYFSPSAVGAQNIVFGGHTYTSVAIQADGFEMNGQGALPQPMLRMGNASNVAGSLAAQNGDLVGAILTRLVTFRQFLDDGASPDSSAIFQPTTWVVVQKTKQNKLYIEWRMASKMDQNGQKAPKRTVWKSYCLWPYRRWDTTLNSGAGGWDYSKVQGCSWTGNTYYDSTGNTVSNPALDVCSKQLGTGCKTRFGATATLPFGGFIGAAPH